MIHVNNNIELDENELEFDFIRASGPGGQNVNKVSTAVQLRFNVAQCEALPEEVRQRLLRQEKNRITQSGVLIVEAREYRSQERNREAAVERLVEMVRRAAVRPKKRQKTQPSRAAKESRLQSKKQHGEKKRLRRYDPQQE